MNTAARFIANRRLRASRAPAAELAGAALAAAEAAGMDLGDTDVIVLVVPRGAGQPAAEAAAEAIVELDVEADRASA